MLRYFTGLDVPEVAAAWGVSVSTVERKWRFVKAWLAREMDHRHEPRASPTARIAFPRGVRSSCGRARSLPGRRLRGRRGAAGRSPTLLAHDGGDDDPVQVVAGAEPPPSSIGPYRILAPSARVASAMVYLAEQEEPVRRQVALKIIKPGLDTREVVARFEAERQALAVMNHPGIARVLDAGATETGRPYFVMEYVAGEPITELLRPRAALDIRAAPRTSSSPSARPCSTPTRRASSTATSSPATSWSAERTAAPVPKVIDFGIAKATEAELDGEDAVHRSTGSIIGTPEYMSPEQAGFGPGDVDTRTRHLLPRASCSTSCWPACRPSHRRPCAGGPGRDPAHHPRGRPAPTEHPRQHPGRRSVVGGRAAYSTAPRILSASCVASSTGSCSRPWRRTASGATGSPAGSGRP